MDIRQFMIQFPIVPPILRGQKTRFFGFHTTEQEADLVQYLAYHPKVKDMYKGQLQNVWRQLLFLYGRHLKEQVDDPTFEPFILSFDALLIQAGLDVTIAELEVRLDTWGRALLTLIEAEMHSAAFDLFEVGLRFVTERPNPWNAIGQRKFWNHPAIKKASQALDEHDYRYFSEIKLKYPNAQ